MFIRATKIVKLFNNWLKWFNACIVSFRKSGIDTVTYLHRRKIKNLKLLQIGQNGPFYQNYFHKHMIIKEERNSWLELRVLRITTNWVWRFIKGCNKKCHIEIINIKRMFKNNKAILVWKITRENNKSNIQLSISIRRKINF